jgi:hypothetical protein
MPPTGGGEHGCTNKGHLPSTGRRRDDEPPLPAVPLIVYQV